MIYWRRWLDQRENDHQNDDEFDVEKMLVTKRKIAKLKESKKFDKIWTIQLELINISEGLEKKALWIKLSWVDQSFHPQTYSQ